MQRLFLRLCKVLLKMCILNIIRRKWSIFFCELHSLEHISKDINDDLAGVLVVNGICVGTGCYRENHITRVYVKPEYQGKGYGTFIMDYLEEVISKKTQKRFWMHRCRQVNYMKKEAISRRSIDGVQWKIMWFWYMRLWKNH